MVDDLESNKRRWYDGTSLRDLLRAIRNKKNHYQDLSSELKDLLGPITDEYLMYFTSKFPLLLMHCHQVVDGHDGLRSEGALKRYFEEVHV